MGRPEQAAINYSDMLVISPQSAAAYHGRGIARRDLLKFEEAAADFSRAMAIDPSSDIYSSGRANAYYRQGKYREAIADYLKTISLNPTFATYYGDLAYSFLAVKDFAPAVANFNKCLERDETAFDAWLGLAIAAYNQGNPAKAKSALQQAVAIEPRLARGMAGIVEVEKEGFYYTEADKKTLRQIFELK
jgi:tetratricopeptide (TPR) repeat protein